MKEPVVPLPYGAGGHLFGPLVQERKNVALVVGDEARTGSEESLACLDQEEMGKDQRAKQLQSRNSTSGPLCVPKGGPPTEPDSETTKRPLLKIFLVR